MAVREAMATELPVIGTKVGGIPELVKEGKTGFLIEVADSKALADKIKLFRETLSYVGGWGRMPGR